MEKSLKQILQNKNIVANKPTRRNYYALPDISTEDFRATFENYELAVLKYNTNVAEKNKKIAAYNKDYNKELITGKYIALQEQFKKLYKNKPVSVYNNEALKWNKIYGFNIIKMRRHTKIKYQTQRVFAKLVKMQAVQLTNRNKARQKMGWTTRMEKSEPINLLVVRKHIADELDINKSTVTAQIKRMKAAGIISHYQFRGADNAFLIRINRRILQISDAFDSILKRTTQNADKQFFKTNENKKTNYNVPDVLVHINENKDNDSEKSESNKEVLNNYQQADNPNNDRNKPSKLNQPEKQEQNFTAGGGSKYQKLSKQLKNSVLHYVIFAKMLFEGFFNNYTPVRNDKIRLEVMYGTLNQVEFQQFLVSELVKMSAKLWKDWKYGTVYQGEWIKTIRILNSKLFYTANGHLMHKDTMFQMFLDYKWRIRAAINYKTLNPDWNPQRPSEYFNPHLKNSGFSKTKDFLRKKKLYDKQNTEIDQQQKTDAFAKEYKASLWRKIKFRIDKLESGKMSPEKFINWINYNVDQISTDEIIKFINDKNASLQALENILKN